MATPRKKRSPDTPSREDRNTDPRWTNWEYLSAFGEDDLGYTYLDAVKRFCCCPSDEDLWLEDLVKRARKAYEHAGSRRSRRQAAWRVFRRAGMILLHDEMGKRGRGKQRPQAVFSWPSRAMIVMVTTAWKVERNGFALTRIMKDSAE